MRPSGYLYYTSDCDGGGGGSGSGAGGGGMSCQDCGNQAKKDCQHMRCRTCCRSRGLPCQTHVKSIWVPAAKRRERQQQLSLSPQQQNSGSNQQLSLMITTGSSTAGRDHIPMRFREDHQHHHHIHGDGSGGCVAVPTTHLHSTSGFPFPAEVSSPAVFRCVRVSGMDEQFAYQTAVRVGGHVFNGILYDHGPDHQGQYNHPVGESSSTGGGQHQEVNLITSGTTASNTGSGSYHSSMYPTPLCVYMAGTQFFPPPPRS